MSVSLREIVKTLFDIIRSERRLPQDRVVRIYGKTEEDVLRMIDGMGEPIRDPSSQPPFGWWIHKKTGHRYEIVTFALIEATLEPSVVYRSEKGQVWIRPAHEFFDGRFQQENSCHHIWKEPEAGGDPSEWFVCSACGKKIDSSYYEKRKQE